uniref:Minor glycoprotein n=1 Tax=Kibale red colobus virus 2 TaxID=1936072 RepID=X2D5W7_9NIDO|nr:minor glycoprotein [Kibale red colobus virus 2]
MEDHHVYRAALCSWLLCLLFRFVLGNNNDICFPVPHEYIIVSINNTLKTCSAAGWNEYPQGVGVCGHKKNMNFNLGDLKGTKSINSSSFDTISFQLHTNFDPLLLVYGLYQLYRYPQLFNATNVTMFDTNTSICFLNSTAQQDVESISSENGEEEDEEDEEGTENYTTNQNVQWPTLREFTYAFSSPLFAPAVLLALPLLLIQL